MNETSTPRKCPYVGLVPFAEEDADWFFGRDYEREMITANLRASVLTLLYGASGTGKSSVLRAGVVHDLRRQARENLEDFDNAEFIVVEFREWQFDPIAGLDQAIREAVGKVFGDREFPTADEPGTLVDRLRWWAEQTGAELLIILDQFEEYFLYHDDDDREAGFGNQFPQAIRLAGLNPVFGTADDRPQPLGVHFLISIREDALAKLDRFKGRIPNLFDNYLRLEHLDLQAARTAIGEPIHRYNENLDALEQVCIEPQLVTQVLSQVLSEQDGGVALPGNSVERDGRSRVETPYLQLVMTRLWAEEREQDSRRLRAKTFETLGGAEGIVGKHVERAMGGIDLDEVTMIAEAFDRLVTPSGSKIAQTESDLAGYANVPVEQLRPSLERLCKPHIRLLRKVAPPLDDPDASVYEIYHDVLGNSIRRWQSQHALQQAGQRVAMLTVGLIAAAVLLAFAVVAMQRAKHAEAKATRAERKANRLASEKERETRYSESKRLAGAAETALANGYPQRAALLAHYAVEATKKDRFVSADAKRAVFSVASKCSGDTLAGHNGPVSSIAFWEEDGKTLLVSGSEDQTVRVWDLSRAPNKRALAILQHTNPDVRRQSASPPAKGPQPKSEELQPESWSETEDGRVYGSASLYVAVGPAAGVIVSASRQDVYLWPMDEIRRSDVLQPIKLSPTYNIRAQNDDAADNDEDSRSITCLCVVSNWVVAGCDDGAIFAWNLLDENQPRRTNIVEREEADEETYSTSGFVRDIIPCSATSFLSASDDAVLFWDLELPESNSLGRPLSLWSSWDSWNVPRPSSSRERALVCVPSDDKTRVWQISQLSTALHDKAEEAPPPFREIPSGGYAATISPTGDQLALTAERQLQLWSFSDNKPQRMSSLALSANWSIPMFVSTKNALITYSSRGNGISLYRVDPMKQTLDFVASPVGHDGPVTSGIINANADYFATASQDYTVHVWDLRSRNVASVGSTDLVSLSDQVRRVAVSNNGQWLLAISRDNHVYRWDLAGRTPWLHEDLGVLPKWEAPNTDIEELRVSSDGNWILTVQMADDGSSVLVSAANAEGALYRVSSEAIEQHVQFELDSETDFGFAAGSTAVFFERGDLQRLDLDTSGTSRLSGASAASISPLGKWLQIFDEGSLRLIDINSGEIRQLSNAYEFGATALSQGETRFASELGDQIHCWDLRSGGSNTPVTKLQLPKLNSRGVESLAFAGETQLYARFVDWDVDYWDDDLVAVALHDGGSANTDTRESLYSWDLAQKHPAAQLVNIAKTDLELGASSEFLASSDAKWGLISDFNSLALWHRAADARNHPSAFRQSVSLPRFIRGTFIDDWLFTQFLNEDVSGIRGMWLPPASSHEVRTTLEFPVPKDGVDGRNQRPVYDAPQVDGVVIPLRSSNLTIQHLDEADLLPHLHRFVGRDLTVAERARFLTGKTYKLDLPVLSLPLDEEPYFSVDLVDDDWDWSVGEGGLVGDGTHESDVGIKGRDDRTLVTDPAVFPFSAVCSLEVYKGERRQVGTGFLVGPNLVVTAGYNLCNNQNFGRGFVEKVVVYAGRNGRHRYANREVVTDLRRIRVSRAWRDSSDPMQCWGVIELRQDLGDRFGSFELRTWAAEQLSEAAVTIAGYPASSTTKTGIAYQMWKDAGMIASVYQHTLRHMMDTSGGTGGAPLFHFEDGRATVVGVHTHSYPGYGQAVRITDTIVDAIRSLQESIDDE